MTQEFVSRADIARDLDRVRRSLDEMPNKHNYSDVAQWAGVSVSVISKVSTGQNAAPNTIARICEALAGKGLLLDARETARRR